jgi:hypothetical protein
VKTILRKAEIQTDFGQLEALVDFQMNRKSSVQVDLVQQKKQFQFNLQILEDTEKKVKAGDRLREIQEACLVIVNNRNLPEFDYSAIEQFEQLNFYKSNTLFF